MAPLVDSRAGAAGTSAARVEPKKLEDGINASTPTRAAMKASTERRTIETIDCVADDDVEDFGKRNVFDAKPN